MRSILIAVCLVLSIICLSPGYADARCGLFGGRQPVRSLIRAVASAKPIRSRLFGSCGSSCGTATRRSAPQAAPSRCFIDRNGRKVCPIN